MKGTPCLILLKSVRNCELKSFVYAPPGPTSAIVACCFFFVVCPRYLLLIGGDVLSTPKARQRMGFSRKPVGGTVPGTIKASGGGGGRSTINTWGDVLMHVVSLPSSSSSSSRSSSSSGSNKNMNNRSYTAINNGASNSNSRHRGNYQHGCSNGIGCGLEAGSEGTFLRRGLSSSTTAQQQQQEEREVVEGVCEQQQWREGGASVVGGMYLPPRAATHASRVPTGNGNAEGYWAAIEQEDDRRRALGHSGRRSLSGELGAGAHVVK